MMEPSVHRDPRIINIDDLRPLFGENLPLFSGPLRRFTSLQGSASPFSAHNLRYLVETRSRSCLLVRRPPPFSSKTSLSFSVTSVTSPRPKSPFTPCYPAQTYRFTILRPASPPNCQLLIREKDGRAREDASSMSRMRKTEDSFFPGLDGRVAVVSVECVHVERAL